MKFLVMNEMIKCSKVQRWNSNLPSPTTPRISNLFITLPMLGIFMKTNSSFDVRHRTWHQKNRTFEKNYSVSRKTKVRTKNAWQGTSIHLFNGEVLNVSLKEQTQWNTVSIMLQYSTYYSIVKCFLNHVNASFICCKKIREKEPQMKWTS